MLLQRHHYLASILLMGSLLTAANSNAAEYHAHAPHDALHGVRLGSPVYLLGRPVGKLTQMGYSDDGRSIELTLSIDDDSASQIFNSSAVVVGKDAKQDFYLEVVRQNEILGIRARDTKSGLLVEQVFANTVASRIGLQPGDTLIEINETKILTLRDWRSFCDSATAGDSLKIRILRENKEGSLIGVTDFKSGMLPLTDDSLLGFSTAAGGSATPDAVVDASLAVQEAAENLIPKLDTALDNAMEMSDYVMEDIHKLLDNTSEMIDEDVKSLLTSLQSTLGDLDETLNRITPKAESTLADYEGIAHSLERLLDQSQQMLSIVQCELQYLPGTMATTQKMICQTSEMVDAIRCHWLVRRVIDRQHRRNNRRR